MATKVNAGKMNSDNSDPEDLKKELMMAQEINFAKVLAGNDKRMRDRAVKKLVKWLAVRSKGKAAFTEDNFRRIWSGLFYCMWMSDKFIVQEELAESISKLVHCFRNNKETALLFMKCFYKIMALEWVGIDQHRIDKFCMLIRRFLRQCLEYCRRADWDDSLVKGVRDVLKVTTLNDDVPNGFLVHFIDIYPEEIAKVSKGKLKVETSLILYEPIIELLAPTKDERTISAVNQFFKHLIKQTDVGIAYDMKLNAWKQMGMPTNKPEDLEMVSVKKDEDEGDEDEDDLDEILAEGPMDPRAGRVDAILPIIPVDADGIISIIEKCMKSKSATTTGLRALKSLKMMFKGLRKGEVPDKIVKPLILNEKRKRRFMSKCVEDLIEFTNKLYEDEANELELTCNEVDTDDEDSDFVNGKESDENVNEKTTKQEKKTRKKKRKKKSLKVEKDEKGIEKHEEKDERDEKKVEKSVKEKKMKKSTKPKSPKETFIVEDVGTESKKLATTPRKKRKALSTWQVHDIETDREEYRKITVPKIIKLEKKGIGRVSSEDGKDEIVDTPVKKGTPQLKLTPSFWDKAKEKVAGKKRKSGVTLFPNPFFPNHESKTLKRISFALDRNEAQENDEYLKEVRNSPSIPFDASKKPVQSVLKSGLSPSPINPFYRFKKLK